MLKHTHVIKGQFTKLEGTGNRYLLCGHVGNSGNVGEAATSEAFGCGFKFDTDHIAYNKGSDIEELKMSVKTSGASLACIYRDDNTAEAFESIINEYFDNVHSVTWAYTILIDNIANIYVMNAEEFKVFIKTWGTMSKESGKTCYKIKFKKTSGKMIKWLEERVEE